MSSSVIWPPIALASLIVGVATQADVATLVGWDADPDIIACAAPRLQCRHPRLFNGEDACLVHRLDRASWRKGNGNA